MSLVKTTAAVMTAALGLSGNCNPPQASDEIWVANRVDGTVSIIEVDSDTVAATLTMPEGGEPMYVNQSRAAGLVFVGDRANSQVVAFDPEVREPVAVIPVGEGVFHQWVLPEGRQLWVNSDVARTTSVIDVASLTIQGTIPMPRDLAAMPGVEGALPKPHDVLVSPEGDAAFVSYVGFAGPNDYIVRFDARTLRETGRAAVGKDVHLSATAENDVLYAPCQGTGAVYVLDRESVAVLERIPLPGAHGAGMATGGAHLYVTNLPAGGDMALFAIDTATDALVRETGVDAPMVGAPHNVALNADDTKVYVTHSGSTAALVSVYEVSEGAPLPRAVSGEITVGLNPFGLGFVAR